MVFLRNYRFDLLHGWRNQQLYIQKRKICSNFSLPFLHQNADTPKSRKFFYFLNFVDIQSPISQYLQESVLPARLQSKDLLPYGRVRYKDYWYWSCIKILIVQNFEKVVISNDSSRLSKWCFTVTTGMISSTRGTISNFTLREKDSIQISVSWFFASKSGHSQE